MASKKWNVISLKSVIGLIAKAIQLILLLNWLTRPLMRTYDPLLYNRSLSYQIWVNVADRLSRFYLMSFGNSPPSPLEPSCQCRTSIIAVPSSIVYCRLVVDGDISLTTPTTVTFDDTNQYNMVCNNNEMYAVPNLYPCHRV